MKNLKLLRFLKHQVVEADCFCSDHDGTVYFGTTTAIFCLENKSKKISVCAEIVPDIINTEDYIIGMEYIVESHSLFLASSSGEVYLYDIYSKQVSSVGHVESRIEGFAWSPDQEFIVLLTGADGVILMTKEFDAISESSLSSDEFGESKPITVGWGSKETQFHGSEGKEAAHMKQKEPKPALSYDDHHPRISWRGDGEYFVTSSIHPVKGYRQLHVWSREAILQYTSEVKEGLEEPICWKPSGNVIACSQQDANKHKIIFFEKNGLQHGEFVLPFKPNTYKVLTLSWNTDSNILLIIAEEICNSPEATEVMLWTCSNYHWYLKQRYKLKNVPSHKTMKSSWCSYNPMELYIFNPSTSVFIEAEWGITIYHSICNNNCDDALVASIDNDNILITPFEKMMVPPPMCAYLYNMDSAVQSIFFSPDVPAFGCYLENVNIALFQKDVPESEKLSERCKLKLVAAGGNGFMPKIKPYTCCEFYSLTIENSDASSPVLCHWTWVKNNKLMCISYDKQNKYCLLAFNLPEHYPTCNAVLHASFVSDLECFVIGMCTNSDGSVVAVQLENRHILRYETELSPWMCDDGCKLIFPQYCPVMSIISIAGKDHVLGLTERYCLYCNNMIILSNCTSYYIHDEFLLTTTANHMLKCFIKDLDLLDIINNTQEKLDVSTQKIEKGARIIIAPSQSTKVVLQMPRGNLETIHPRPLVLSSVCKYLDDLQFGKAFELSKVHRIDLNILFDHNPKQFLNHIKQVFEELNSPSNLNLFLASIKNEDVCETLYPFAYKGKQRTLCTEFINSKVNILCNSFREVLEQKDDDRFYLTLMATYAKKSEPELDKALIRLKKLKDASNEKSTQTLVDNALNFLLYLVDVNELINVALGTYDLEITIMVAQKSQKDPKEFLPFYNELQKLEENYRKYKIDMHLQRYKPALLHISKCEDHFEECLSLIKSQRLYVDALYLFPNLPDKSKLVWKEYGHYLLEKKYYDEAGLIFTRCEDHENALVAYQAALDWQSMFCSTVKLGFSDDKIIAFCREMSERLKSNQKYLDASYLLEHYVKDIEESIVTLIEGCEWNTALLLISKYSRYDIVETHLKPALEEHYSYLNSHMAQLSKDFHTHTERLKYLRSQKNVESELPDLLKHNEGELFSETGSVTDIASSCAESKQFSGSIMTRKSSKSGRKQKLKMYRLKEGSPHEDLAHISALSEIIIKIDSLKDNFLNSLKGLVQFGFDNFAQELQKQMTSLVAVVELEMPIIWPPTVNAETVSELRFGPDSTANSIAAALQSERNAAVAKHKDAELTPPQWRKLDLVLLMFR